MVAVAAVAAAALAEAQTALRVAALLAAISLYAVVGCVLGFLGELLTRSVLRDAVRCPQEMSAEERQEIMDNPFESRESFRGARTDRPHASVVPAAASICLRAKLHIASLCLMPCRVGLVLLCR